MLRTLHPEGVMTAFFTLLIIGLFHPLVIKAEYYFGCKVWPVFFAAGLLFIAFSLSVPDPFINSLLAVTGAACLWSIRELFEQRERVKKGWWPANPDRKE